MRKNVASQKIGAQMVSATDGSAFTGSVTVAVTVDAGTQATGSVGSGACTHEGNGYHTYAPAQAETNGDLIAFTFTGTGAVPATVQVFTAPATGFLAPTVADRTLDVSAGGAAGVDWANVENPTTAVGLSGTTVKAVTDGVTLAAAAVQAIWDAATSALTTAGSIGKRIVDYLTGDIYARLGAPAGASVSADIAATKTVADAVKAKTDSLTFTQAGHVDANIRRINDVAITGDGSGTPFNV